MASDSVSKLDPFIKKHLEHFVITFQKPIQIYRFLIGRWRRKECPPLFMKRTLSYVRKRDRHASRKPPGGLLYYNWICETPQISKKTHQHNFECPFCRVDYHDCDTLVTHLKCWHLRLNFNLYKEGGVYVIDIALNKDYDGSYCGFKYPGHDLRQDFRFASPNPKHPYRRITRTQIIFFRPRIKALENISIRHKSVNEKDRHACEDTEADVDVCNGRLYYHTSTCLPVKPNELDIDSEADIDPEWLRERTQLMIDEFTDVNEGEKEILKLWNLHIMKNYQYKGDHMMRKACLDFVELEGQTILSKNLSKNFTLHLANLYDFGLISSRDLLDCMRKLNKMGKASITNSVSRIVARIKSERKSTN